MKKVSLVLAIILTLTVCICGCNNKSSQLIGEWTMTQDNSTLGITFLEDKLGTISRDGLSAGFTYSIEDDKITIIPDGDPADIMEATYSISGDKLTMITDGIETVFTRVR